VTTAQEFTSGFTTNSPPPPPPPPNVVVGGESLPINLSSAKIDINNFAKTFLRARTGPSYLMHLAACINPTEFFEDACIHFNKGDASVVKWQPSVKALRPRQKRERLPGDTRGRVFFLIASQKRCLVLGSVLSVRSRFRKGSFCALVRVLSALESFRKGSFSLWDRLVRVLSLFVSGVVL